MPAIILSNITASTAVFQKLMASRIARVEAVALRQDAPHVGFDGPARVEADEADQVLLALDQPPDLVGDVRDTAPR